MQSRTPVLAFWDEYREQQKKWLRKRLNALSAEPTLVKYEANTESYRDSNQVSFTKIARSLEARQKMPAVCAIVCQSTGHCDHVSFCFAEAASCLADSFVVLRGSEVAGVFSEYGAGGNQITIDQLTRRLLKFGGCNATAQEFDAANPVFIIRGLQSIHFEGLGSHAADLLRGFIQGRFGNRLVVTTTDMQVEMLGYEESVSDLDVYEARLFSEAQQLAVLEDAGIENPSRILRLLGFARSDSILAYPFYLRTAVGLLPDEEESLTRTQFLYRAFEQAFESIRPQFAKMTRSPNELGAHQVAQAIGFASLHTSNGDIEVSRLIELLSVFARKDARDELTSFVSGIAGSVLATTGALPNRLEYLDPFLSSVLLSRVWIDSYPPHFVLSDHRHPFVLVSWFEQSTLAEADRARFVEDYVDASGDYEQVWTVLEHAGPNLAQGTKERLWNCLASGLYSDNLLSRKEAARALESMGRVGREQALEADVFGRILAGSSKRRGEIIEHLLSENFTAKSCLVLISPDGARRFQPIRFSRGQSARSSGTKAAWIIEYIRQVAFDSSVGTVLLGVTSEDPSTSWCAVVCAGVLVMQPLCADGTKRKNHLSYIDLMNRWRGSAHPSRRLEDVALKQRKLRLRGVIELNQRDVDLHAALIRFLEIKAAKKKDIRDIVLSAFRCFDQSDDWRVHCVGWNMLGAVAGDLADYEERIAEKLAEEDAAPEVTCCKINFVARRSMQQDHEFIWECTQVRDDRVRHAAILGFARRKDARLQHLFEKLEVEKCSRCREATLLTVGWHGDVAYAEAFYPLLFQEQDATVLTAVLVGLRWLAGSRHVRALVDLLGHDNPGVVAECAYQLGEIGSDVANDKLAELLLSAESIVRSAALLSLQKLGDYRAREYALTILEAASDREPELFLALPIARGAIPDHLLLRFLNSGHLPLVKASCLAVRRCSNGLIHERLRHMAVDSTATKSLRRMAGRALINCQDKDADHLFEQLFYALDYDAIVGDWIPAMAGRRTRRYRKLLGSCLLHGEGGVFDGAAYALSRTFSCSSFLCLLERALKSSPEKYSMLEGRIFAMADNAPRHDGPIEKWDQPSKEKLLKFVGTSLSRIEKQSGSLLVRVARCALQFLGRYTQDANVAEAIRAFLDTVGWQENTLPLVSKLVDSCHCNVDDLRGVLVAVHSPKLILSASTELQAEVLVRMLTSGDKPAREFGIESAVQLISANGRGPVLLQRVVRRLVALESQTAQDLLQSIDALVPKVAIGQRKHVLELRDEIGSIGRSNAEKSEYRLNWRAYFIRLCCVSDVADAHSNLRRVALIVATPKEERAALQFLLDAERIKPIEDVDELSKSCQDFIFSSAGKAKFSVFFRSIYGPNGRAHEENLRQVFDDVQPGIAFMVGHMGAIKNRGARLMDVVIPIESDVVTRTSVRGKSELGFELAEKKFFSKELLEAVARVDWREVTMGKFEVVSRKVSIAVPGKLENINSRVATQLREHRKEEVCGIEEEAGIFGLANKPLESAQTRPRLRLMLKGVADYCGDKIDLAEAQELPKHSEVSGDMLEELVPSENEALETALQNQAVRNSIVVLLELLEAIPLDLCVPHVS